MRGRGRKRGRCGRDGARFGTRFLVKRQGRGFRGGRGSGRQASGREFGKRGASCGERRTRGIYFGVSAFDFRLFCPFLPHPPSSPRRFFLPFELSPSFPQSVPSNGEVGGGIRGGPGSLSRLCRGSISDLAVARGVRSSVCAGHTVRPALLARRRLRLTPEVNSGYLLPSAGLLRSPGPQSVEKKPSGIPPFDTTVRRRPDRSRPPQVGP